MSDRSDEKTQLGFLEQFRVPAVRAYILTGLAALMVYYILMTSRDGGSAGGGYGVLLTLVIAVPGLTSRWVISPILFMILFSYQLFDPDFQGLIARAQGRWHSERTRLQGIELDDLLLAGSILVYTMAHYRLMSFVHTSMPDDPAPRRKGQPEPDIPRRPFGLFGDGELGMMLGISAASVVIGAILWLLISGYESGERLAGSWGLSRSSARFIVFLWSVGTGAVLVGVAFRYLALRGMSWFEARLIVQDLFYQETRREQERIYRWRVWASKRKSARAAKGGK